MRDTIVLRNYSIWYGVFLFALGGNDLSNPVGRPPMYKSKEEIQEKIDKYFEECEGKVLEDKEGNPILNKWGNPVIIGVRPPTITGLALALGFTSRQALLNYQDKNEFVDTITRAKTRVEQYAEERLFDRDGSHGAQFSLRNNFKGWSNKDLEDKEQTYNVDDGFMDALNATAKEDWNEKED